MVQIANARSQLKGHKSDQYAHVTEGWKIRCENSVKRMWTLAGYNVGMSVLEMLSIDEVDQVVDHRLWVRGSVELKMTRILGAGVRYLPWLRRLGSLYDSYCARGWRH